MSPLVTLENISLSFGLQPVLSEVKLQVEKGERICIIGYNGAGKSSLMKIIDGSMLPDSGQVWRKPGLRIARLSQELPTTEMTVFDFVAQGSAETASLLAEYHVLIHQMDAHSEKQMEQLDKLQSKITACDGWQLERRINTMLSRLSLKAEDKLADLSGGWLRRAALAQALAIEPELLLLDEPTNHLDIAAIQWLEEELLSLNCAVVLITHDREFLQKITTRIVELDRGKLTSWPGDYQNFLQRKEEMLHAESRHNALFDKRLAEEEVWIRQGIKARRTRNEGRVRALEAMRQERTQRRERQRKANFSFKLTEQSGDLVVDAQHVSHGFEGKNIIQDLSLRIMRGDKIGLIGPNGVGKTTLLSILLGNLTPQQGQITLGSKLKVAYFDQRRAMLDVEKNIIDNVVDGSDYVEVNGQKKHVIGYLSDFLFTPARARTPVKALSGGECNRLLLAKLFTQPANLLVMDEPTNDLDIETLELLEELLTSYQGTLLLVSHDRSFLDNVVTSTLVFEGNGKIEEYIGGYKDFLSQRKMAEKTSENKTTDSKPQRQEIKSSAKKLSYKEQQELASLPALIEKLEQEQTAMQALIADPAFYQKTQAEIAEKFEQLKEVEMALENAYTRWDILDNAK